MEDDPLLTLTNDEAFADRLMTDQHWVDEDGAHYVVTAVLRDTMGVDGPAWAVHGYVEGGRRSCPVVGP